MILSAVSCSENKGEQADAGVDAETDADNGWQKKCDYEECRRECIEKGALSGACNEYDECECFGGPDSGLDLDTDMDTDSDMDIDTDIDVDTDGDTDSDIETEPDIFIARYSSDGTLAWAKRAGGKTRSVGTGIDVTDTGDIMLTGYFHNASTFGPGESAETTIHAEGSWDEIFIAGYNPDGTLDWVKAAGGRYDQYTGAISAGSNNTAVIAGYFHDRIAFEEGDPDETVFEPDNTFHDAFFAAYTDSGEFEYAGMITGSHRQYASAVEMHKDGTLYMTGTFEVEGVFGLGEPNETTCYSIGGDYHPDMFIARYETDGGLMWAGRAGTTEEDSGNTTGRDIAVLPDGSVLVTGAFESTTVFGPGEPNETVMPALSEPDPTIFIAKYSAGGDLIWVKSAGGEDGCTGEGIAALIDGSFYIAGDYSGTAVFGRGESNETGISSFARGDIYIARYNSDGSLEWVRSAGSTEEDYIAAIAIAPDQDVLVLGCFIDTTVFALGQENETSLVAYGGRRDLDTFIARYNSDGTLEWVRQIGGHAHDWARDIVLFPDGSFAVTGWFEGTAIFGRNEAQETELAADH